MNIDNVSRKVLANAIRILSMDSVENANSGHPGAPMGMSDIAEVLWRDYINHNPSNPNWINRDRFILSNGHSSILLYSILHLTGYNVSIEDLKNFRKINSLTPGHPEYRHTPGVEITTGPLGQGISNAVGFAIAEKLLSSKFNKDNFNIIDHYTYVFVGDGCLMEGISHESCSIAGNLNLGKLIVFYDKNGISIDGEVKNWFNDDTELRFKSYKWHVINNIDGHNCEEIKKSIEKAKSITDRPTIIICNTIIAFGSPNKSGKSISHGSPLGNEELINVRKSLNWDEYELFKIPKYIYDKWNFIDKGKNKELNWNKKFIKYSSKYPILSKELIRRINRTLPDNWDFNNKLFLDKFLKDLNIDINISTRKSSLNVLNKIGPILPELLGGSADLSSSNLTYWDKSLYIKDDFINGNYIHYGVREFGMTAIANGISIYGGFIPYTSTFLVFSDYAKNAIRMSALMKAHHIFVYTHDSICLGEDGPTHQPIEQLNSLREIPNLILWRPCDQIETLISWKYAIENKNGPTVIILSRQNLKQQYRDKCKILNIKKGGYILNDNTSNKNKKLVIISTGSEINISVLLFNYFKEKNFNIRIVSIPSTNIFDLQNSKYKEYVLPKNSTKIVIELSTTNFWYKYIENDGEIIGINSFGKSGSEKDLLNFFKFDFNNLVNKIKRYL
ncbi:transketolase 1 [endosymbiont of Sipalinus gigas]|uniref:transketolase n=1 Tax=endosymbiont of Sipalinus gigas TaxID=1972134 RepID=UPI000DC6EAD5|nr:transketolase [endosymbiont of Sipalinus gigas]BBA85353.1 transketolase 1 [endosymbiont of Sipalinus gigas]